MQQVPPKHWQIHVTWHHISQDYSSRDSYDPSAVESCFTWTTFMCLCGKRTTTKKQIIWGKFNGQLKKCTLSENVKILTSNHVLQKKMGRDFSIDFWRQLVTRPCILLLLNSITSILCWVQYCIQCVIVFSLYTTLGIHAMLRTKQLHKTRIYWTVFGPWCFDVM